MKDCWKELWEKTAFEEMDEFWFMYKKAQKIKEIMTYFFELLKCECLDVIFFKIMIMKLMSQNIGLISFSA